MQETSSYSPPTQAALLVGINKYPAGISSCSTAVHGAEKMRDLLASKYGFECEQPVESTNLTKREIVRAIKRYMPDGECQIDPTGSLIIYFAGEGGFSEDQTSGYFVPGDAAVDDPTSFCTTASFCRSWRRSKSAIFC